MFRSFPASLAAMALLTSSFAGIEVSAERPPDGAASSIEVNFQEWPTATPKSFPHDPAVAPDGSAWYTGMRANVLGRMDPATGAIKDSRCQPGTRALTASSRTRRQHLVHRKLRGPHRKARSQEREGDRV